jgi:hypothetical protein
MSRSNLILTGAFGLVAGLVVTTLCLFVMSSGWLPVLVSRPLYVWSIFLFLLFFSLAEIPVMIFGMRKMAASVNPKAKYVVLFANAGYTFFASVYAAPFILLAGQSVLELFVGALLGALGIIRFITSVLFLPNQK